jgi:hypothetical protein
MEENGNQKRRTIGMVPVAKVSKVAEWKAFEAASKEFSESKAKLTASKDKFRTVLRKHSPALNDVENLEYQVSVDRSQIIIYEKLEARKRQTSGRREIEFS